MSDRSPLHADPDQHLRRLRSATAAAYLVAFLMLTVTIAYALTRVQAAHHNLESVLTLHERTNRLITETQIASFRRADTVQLMTLETDPFRRDEIFMAFLRHGFEVGDGRNKIRALLTNDLERAVMARQDAIIAEAVELHDTIADLSREGRSDEARSLFVNRLSQLHEDGHATFQALRDLQTSATAAAVAAANHEYHSALNRSIAAMVLSLIVSVAIGLLMHRVNGRISSRLRDNVGDLQQLATRDALTGLFNRTAITHQIQRQFNHSALFALLYMDLDGFKQVNDRHGHEVGDRFLAMAAARIRGRMRGIDDVARLGGDEFVAVIHGVRDIHECQHVARHVIEAFEQPFVYGELEATIGISIGIAIAPADGSSAVQILAAADQAMYRAKRRGSNHFEACSGQIPLPFQGRIAS